MPCYFNMTEVYCNGSHCFKAFFKWYLFLVISLLTRLTKRCDNGHVLMLIFFYGVGYVAFSLLSRPQTKITVLSYRI